MEENLKRLERKFALIGEENGYDINFFNPKIIAAQTVNFILQNLGFPMMSGEVFREEITRGCLGFGRRGFWKKPSIT